MARPKQLSDLDRLRLQAEDLWDHQQAGIAKARQLAAEAGRQGADYTRERIAPRVRSAYGSGVAALGSALATVQAFRDKEVREALSAVPRFRVQSPVVVTERKRSSAGLWIGLGLGAVAAAAVGYVVWQTLRADDDLWIEDGDLEILPPAEPAASAQD